MVDKDPPALSSKDLSVPFAKNSDEANQRHAATHAGLRHPRSRFLDNESFPCDGGKRSCYAGREECIDKECVCLKGRTGNLCLDDLDECQLTDDASKACDFEGSFCVNRFPDDETMPYYYCGCAANEGWLEGTNPPGANGQESCIMDEHFHSRSQEIDMIDEGDLGIRFNTITFVDGIVPSEAANALPLGPEDYPICPDTAEWLRESQAVSVIQSSDCAECDIPLSVLIDAIGGYPSHPSSTNMEYWEELWEVVQVQEMRLNNGTLGNLLKLPGIWSGYDIHDVAKAVHDEYPGSHHVELIKYLLRQGAKIDRDILPALSGLSFVRGPVALAVLNTWAIGTVAPHNFQVKWAAGRARPEEVAWWIHEADEAELSEKGVPEYIVTHIKAMNLADASSFTAYTEGSPKHPSWPAMHSAASVSSLWLNTVMDLTPAQQCEVFAVDYAVAYARTVAGVHFPQDNIAGLNLGQEILARKLPGYMAERYGSNPQSVRNKIATLRIDWNTYLEGPCFS